MRASKVFLGILLAAPWNIAQAQKEQPLPKDLPPYGSQQPLRVREVKVSRLDNGLTVWLVPQPGLPKVAYSITVRGGLAADLKDRPGLSELLASTLDQGTKSRSARQIAEELQATGGDFAAEGGPDSISINTTVLSAKADAALEVLADVFENASFPESEVSLAKRNLADSLRQREASPEFLARRALAKALYKDNAYSIIAPTQDSIEKSTAAELRQEFARRFRPDQALFVAVGDFDEAKMTALVRQKLGSWSAPKTEPVADALKPAGPAPHAVFVVPRPGSVQTVLALGAFGPLRGDADYESTAVANAIYGGTFSSRLVSNIREDKGYTYSPGSRVQTLRAAGVLRTQAAVRNAVTAASLNEIAYELNRMVTTSPTDEELTKAKRYLSGIQAIQLQSRESVARAVASLWVDGLPSETLSLYGQKIGKVTAADVDAAAQKYFPASRMTVVAVGEEKLIRDSLAPYGIPIQPAP